MSRISIELVPRGETELRQELEQVRRAFPDAQTINIPDLPRFPMRSWTGAIMARDYVPAAIPHIRARDIDPDRPLAMAESLQRHGIKEILVIAGDPPPDVPSPDPAPGSLEIIRKFKREWPEIKVYAAIDPYRNSFRAELDYVHAKREAGADGFFTQPFFDVRLMDVFAELLAGEEIFWGVSPVLTKGARNYWEQRNRAFFPTHFAPTLAWNQRFAREALTFVRQNNAHIYFMPIMVDVEAYLTGVFS